MGLVDDELGRVILIGNEKTITPEVMHTREEMVRITSGGSSGVVGIDEDIAEDYRKSSMGLGELDKLLIYQVKPNEVNSNTWVNKVVQRDFRGSEEPIMAFIGKLPPLRAMYKLGLSDISQFNRDIQEARAEVVVNCPSYFKEPLGWYSKKVLVELYLEGRL